MDDRFRDVVEEKKQSGGSQAAEDSARTAGDEETKRLNVRVPEPLYEAYKHKVESEGRTMTWVVLQHMRNYIRE
jgi:predicted DNA binding CopG/RHH family protein